MISDKVIIADHGQACDGFEAGMAMVEKVARFVGYDTKETERLKLLAEEMITGSSAILDIFTGTLWVETDKTMFKLYLEMQGSFTPEEREHLISLTRDNKNTYPKGFFAKLGALLGDALSGSGYYYPGFALEQGGAEVLWSAEELVDMVDGMRKETDPEDEALQSASKVILDAYADNIQVGAHANYVKIMVSKALPEKK